MRSSVSTLTLLTKQYFPLHLTEEEGKHRCTEPFENAASVLSVERDNATRHLLRASLQVFATDRNGACSISGEKVKTIKTRRGTIIERPNEDSNASKAAGDTTLKLP